MSYAGPAARGAGPSQGWYALLGLVVTVTVVVTGLIGLGRATDLMDEVEGFQRFGGSDTAIVSVVEPGRYAVYHEWIERGNGNPYASGPPSTDAEYSITVTGLGGVDVPVRPIDTSYGWRSRHGDGVASFEAGEPGTYQISATGPAGQLAFGRSIPGAPLYGFGGVLFVAGVVVAACVAGAVLVATRRRTTSTGATRASAVVWRAPALAGLGVVALVGGGLWLSGRSGGSDISASTSGSAGGVTQPSTTLSCTSDADFETGLCGVSPEELREINLGYADRLAFSGDVPAASAVADEARAALAPLAGVLPAPPADQVQAALAPVSTDVQVSTSAVRTSGTAFGIAVDGGCVFGSVHDGAVDMEIGGYVNDGGCLASYGH